jgi:sucrose phosphorylase
MDNALERALTLLVELYGQPAGQAACMRLASLVDQYRPLLLPQPGKPASGLGLTEKDALLIAYGDQLRQAGVRPLQVLADFCERRLPGLISGVHLLPFYPFSSDDGFSVIDYRAVDPVLGSWEDIARLGRSFRLMFDAVINHVSAHSRWFQGFLRDDPQYRDYFITISGDPDLSQVVRPRALPLLTRFETPSGPKRVWTTFSADQIDLDYHNPDVLLEILEVLLFYISQGRIFAPGCHRLPVERAGTLLHPPAPDPPGGAADPRRDRGCRPAGQDHHRDERPARRQYRLFWRRDG